MRVSKELKGLKGINVVKRLKILLKCFKLERPPKVNSGKRKKKMFITINARNMQCCVFISFSSKLTGKSRAYKIKCVSCFIF